MTVTVPFSSRYWSAEVEHHPGDANLYWDIPVKSPSRLCKVWMQPINGNAGAGEEVELLKYVQPYGTWSSISPVVDQAIIVGANAWTLDSEGACAANGIHVGSILRVTGVVAADTPDRTVTRVVVVLGIAVLEGQPDVILVRDIWTSVPTACDTGATLEVYDTTTLDARTREDIWRDVTPEALIDEALDVGETAATLDSEGAAAAAGIVVGSIIRMTATITGDVTGTEIALVTAITLSGGNPDVLTLVRGFWGSTAHAFDDDQSKLEVLNGRISTSTDLGNDNVRTAPANLDDDYLDFEDHSFLRVWGLIDAVEARVGALFVPYSP